MKNIILALVFILISFPAFAGQCSSGSCGRSVGAVKAPMRCLFRRFRARKSCRHDHVCASSSCCNQAECCKEGDCSAKMAEKPAVCTKAACPAGCSVDECCDKSCGTKCCPSKKCKCTHCK